MRSDSGPRDDRPAIRRRSNLVLTNPDMLNMGLLAHHKGWGDFLTNLEWVVVDEAHTYRGVFGSHVANVLRRLRRVARVYGSDPRFILASATIANPVELATELTGTEFELIDTDGAPRAKRRIAIWNPPVVDAKTMSRRSVLSEAAELLCDLVVNGSRTICFLRSRRGIELIQRFARMRLEQLGEPQLAARIAPYRAGYTPQQRREIEAQARRRGSARGGRHRRARARDRHRRARRGDLRHLPRHGRQPAPDVGARRAPQRGDRALRRRRGRARPVLLSPPGRVPRTPGRGGDPRPRERADPDRPLVAAAYEAPLGGSGDQPGAADDEVLGERWRERADALVGAGRLRRGRDGRYLPRGPGFPAGEISLRSASLDSVAVVERASGELLGQVEAERAFSTVHPERSTSTWAAPTRSRELDVDAPPRDRRRLRRRLVHAAEEGDGGLHRGDRRAAAGRPSRRRASSSTSARSRSPSR